MDLDFDSSVTDFTMFHKDSLASFGGGSEEVFRNGENEPAKHLTVRMLPLINSDTIISSKSLTLYFSFQKTST